MSKKLFCFVALVLLLGLGLTNAGNAFTPPSPPNWTLEIISWPLEKAYPGIEYNIRLGVIGGRYPYSFSLVDAPSGMSITSDKGEISWTPDTGLEGQSFDVSVKVVDQLSQEVYQNFSVSVTKNGFYFIATNGSDSTGDGSIGNPWKTMSYAVTQGTTADILYVRGGTYVGRIIVSNGNINKWIAYPGEQPTFNLNQENPYTDGVVDEYAYIDGFELINAQTKGFFCQAGHLIARRNHMHHLYTDGPGMNPAFIFWPIGYEEYNVIQDNIFHDLYSENDHGASVIFYDIRYSLYEDNEAYNIEGRGVGDKEGGYHNTFRNNVLHDTTGGGVRLESQAGQDQLEVSYNLTYNTGGEGGVVIGWQPGYTRDVYVHHNTIVDSPIKFRDALNDPTTDNINIYNNIVTNGNSWLYACYPTVEGLVLADNIVHVDNNLLWTTGSYVFGYGYTTSLLTFAEWQSYGKDLNGILDDPQLDANYNLPPGSPYFGIYGREIDTGGAPGQASNPSPANSATDVSVDADLSWTAGSGATSHDVYFGTDSTPDSGEFQGNQTATTFDPGTMANDTTYYWRIDEVNAEGTTTGNLWNFTTEAVPSPPGQASNPSPADSATDVSTTADLSWTAGSGATSRDVYFGTISPGTYQGNQTETTFDPGTMANDTTYYWRIDEINAQGTTTGTVWSFTTAAAAAGDVEIIGSWISGTSHTEEAGTDRALVFTAHAESATADTDLGSVTYGGQSMIKVVDRIESTTYSAYTAAFVLDEAGINAASGSTFVVTWNTAPSGTPAFTSVFLQNINQSSLTGATGTGGSTTTTAETPALSTSDGDMAIVAGTCGNDAAYSTINGFTEAIEVAPSSADGIGGYLSSTGGNVTPGISHTNVNRQSVIGFVVQAGTGGPTPPGQASNPSPADSATGVSVNADLSWSAGSGATSRDVYFGTTSPGSFQGNQTATTFEPGTMANDTTYYWRIDEVNAAGTTTGTVWSFTTIVAAPAQATNPNPADSATGVSTTADLNWTAGSGATSHDVYFGTSSPGSFQGNQTATTFNPGTMANDTTYYWRIDEVNAGGTTTGTVWSFTTIVAAPGAASSPSPADSASDIAVDADLSWSAGSSATSHDVYFGTASPGSFQGNQTATTFDPGAMADDTTYYWRIDEVNAGGTTTGTIWSFTTVVSGGQVTEEFGDATNTDNPGTVEDTFTNSGSSGGDNYSTNVLLSVYTWPADTIANTTIIKWDLSTIPTDATVTEATLYLYQTDSGGDSSYDVPVHKIINVNPVITTCTWNTYDGTNNWTGGADGGQGDTSVAEDTQVLNSTNNEYKTWSVTNMVQDWVTTPSSNYGMLANSDGVASVDSFRYFASTDDSDSSIRPKLIVTYISGGQASNPNPADNDVNVPVDEILSWTPGDYADTHDVYLGTDVNAVSDANQSSAEFMGNVDVNSYDPGGLAYDTTYYWAIDEVNDTTTWPGDVWSFTTETQQPPAQASSPSPADSAVDVSITADLSWTAGAGADSHDVYFGTTSPGSFQGNQTETTFDPGILSNDTTYYWRIDEINGGGTTTGNVWSFTTIIAAPGQASNPSPADSATDVSIDTDLSWTPGAGSTSSDVYFGTTSPGAFQSNQTATTFDPGTLNNNTTYYWRIDEKNVGGTTTGVVWSFTTIEAAPGQASNPAPADSATNVNIDADLSWTAGTGATSHDVYFGTISPGSFQGNQAATTFDPGTMANDTTYYWRIDEVSVGGTTTGVVWSFATVVSTGDEIIGWWELNDASGNTAADSSAYNNDGTLVGSPAWTDDAERGWCLDFTGDDNYVAIPNESFFDISGDITLMAWMKDNYIDWRNLSTIIAKGMDSSGGFALQKARRDNGMSFYVDVSGMPWDGIKAGVGIFDNQWHHVAGVYDGSNAYIYIDGGLDSNSVACSGSMATNDWDVYIGENSQSLDGGSNGREWDGLLSDVRVYNYALTQSEINDIYTGGPTPPGQASNPSPADSAVDVSIDADLSWTAGSGSTSSDVYFGTTSPGAFQGNQTATTFDLGTMANDTTYYWRIDEINAEGTTTGVVWSFTTVAAPAGDVEIIGSWLSGTTHTAEAGANRLLLFTAHTEDNNADMDLTSVTYGGQSMTKVVEQNVGSGYRAYVVAYILDEAGINAASGSDFVVTWAETPSRSPGFSSVFLQNVSQSAPTAATDGNGTESSSTLATGALSTNDGDMVFVAGTCGNSGTYSVNNGFTEGIEISISSADAVAGYKAATGAAETPSITHSNVNRQVVIGFVVQAE